MKSLQDNVAEIEVSYLPTVANAPIMSSPKEAYSIFLGHFPPQTISLQERFLVAYLNNANKVLGIYEQSVGGIGGTVADPRLILSVALKIAATSIVLCHNHPSGQLKPSRTDFELTSKLKEASKLLDVKLQDHLIVIPGSGYYSWAEEGLL